MIVLSGKGVSGGIAIGTLNYYSREIQSIDKGSGYIPEKEEERLKKALLTAEKKLGSSAEEFRGSGNESAALIMEAYIGIVEDPDFTETVKQKLVQKKISAEAAVMEAGYDLSEVFRKMDREKMRALAGDIVDAAKYLKDVLAGSHRDIIIDSPCVFASDNLSPSETATLDRDKLLAFVTSGGSAGGHTAVLARSFGIPAVVSVGAELSPELHDRTVIVNGFSGEVIFDPDEKTIEKYEKEAYENELRKNELNGLKGLSNTTAGGKNIKLYCNIKSPDEVADVKSNDADGIGLFRTEFLFLNREESPSEEEQFEAYRKVVSEIYPGEVVIRTIDIGADKTVPYLSQEKEENPALGLRGIRLCLENRELFITQLRALYRASAYGKMLIMFPMVSGVNEVLEAKDICRSVVEGLKEEGIAVDEKLPLGVMVETPSAALISDELAKIVDFFSCGTNDLTQYTLACDRTNGKAGRYYDHKHASVLKLLQITTENAHKAGIWVGVCGEAASDTDLTEALISMGIDELSVSPAFVLPVRKKIRSLAL